MNDSGRRSHREKRIYFLDNLRTFLIFLVVLVHAGLVYESRGMGALFWIVDDYSTNSLADWLTSIVDIFAMACMFFISGYFAPRSLKSKSPPVFLKTKFLRLMVPWVIAVLTLIPLYKFIYLYSRNIPQENWTTYFHFNNELISQSWLWFIPVLFLFETTYLAITRIYPSFPAVKLKTAVVAAFILGFGYSLGTDILGIQGWTKTALLDFQNERLLIYFMMFLLGVVCYNRKTFDTAHGSGKSYFTVLFTAWLPVSIYGYFHGSVFSGPGMSAISPIADKVILWLSFNLSLFSLLYLSLNTFRLFLDRRSAIIDELNRNSYSVYIIHTIVIGLIATSLLNAQLPSLLKYLILTVSSYAASNLIVFSGRSMLIRQRIKG